MKTTFRSLWIVLVCAVLVLLCQGSYAAPAPTTVLPSKLPMGSMTAMADYCVTNSEFTTNGSVSFELGYYDRNHKWINPQGVNLPKRFHNYQDFVALMSSNAVVLAAIVRTNSSYAGYPVLYAVTVYQNFDKTLLSIASDNWVGSLWEANSNTFAACAPHYIQGYVPLEFTALEVKVRDSDPPYTYGLTNGVMTLSSEMFPPERNVSGYIVLQPWYYSGTNDVRITIVVSPTKFATYTSFGDIIKPPTLAIMLSNSVPCLSVEATPGTLTTIEQSSCPTGPWKTMIVTKSWLNPIPRPISSQGYFRAFSN